MRSALPVVAVLQALLGCAGIVTFCFTVSVPRTAAWGILVIAAAGLALDRRWGWWLSIPLHVYNLGEAIFLMHQHGPSKWAVAILMFTTFFLFYFYACSQYDDRVGIAAKSPWLVWPLTIAVLLISGNIGHMLYNATSASEAGAAHGDIMACRDALQLYYADVSPHRYPSTLTQLLRDDATGWSGPYIATITSDPWDNAYQYQTDGTIYTLMSVHDHFGADVRETIRYVSTDSEAVWLP